MNIQQDLLILHWNISSISVHIDDFRTFFNCSNHKFGIMCISESRISTKHPKTTNIDLPDVILDKLQLSPSLEGFWSVSPKTSDINLERIFRYSALKTGICELIDWNWNDSCMSFSNKNNCTKLILNTAYHGWVTKKIFHSRWHKTSFWKR